MCLEAGAKVGEVVVFQQGPRFICSLITKGQYWEKPTFENHRAMFASVKKFLCHPKGVMPGYSKNRLWVEWVMLGDHPSAYPRNFQ